MKPFDLEKAKAGKPVCTLRGNSVRIVCYDVKDNAYPILALVQEGDIEVAKQYTIEGFYIKGKEGDERNLMMASVKHEGWVNIYRLDDGKISPGAYVNDSKEEAMKATIGREKRLIATVKIEWEE